ncbi:peptide/nickel transport system ATP-binding protein [Variovorax boronicumulans]|uniref:Peptide/nickel transport system ATP-binding protein n=1 Tax=Variovorax boronicumulans TaxID=436515 RepID=A0AAW8DTK1_9BURK|nr:ABC transporter ATP-binding protein [Variovorax boronicumulans]MDP9877585.1 peptide/nickel transport system ATP-binding protein [Variovorax boronicumulans]MDP9922870.1 peptide/nickel transport system ATP-binding protein [Variovorax boronicumulans]
MSPLLHIEGLSVALPEGSERPFAVHDVSLQVLPGQTVCVVGESGSGKSVMANAVMRLLPRNVLRVAAGRITLQGQDLLSLDAASMCTLRGARMAMIFQEPMTALNPVMTVGDQIDEVLLVHGRTDGAARTRRVIELMAEMNLPEPETLRHRYPFQLSGGQRQRILIAMAMALEPQLLIADEPTTALDVTTQAQILALIQRLQRRHGLGVLFITHDFGVVADIADQVVVMQQGRVVESAGAAQVLGRPSHAYTRRLIDAVPRLRAAQAQEQAPAATAPLLEISRVSKSYRARGTGLFGARGRTLALDDVSLCIGQGETVGLIGESGSGKTTLGHCVMRLLDIDSGSLRFNGQSVEGLRGRALAALRPQIQMIFQDPFASLNPRHRVRRIITENVILGGVSPAEAQRRMEQVLALVGIDPAAVERYPHEFSGGQRQRIGIARALVMQPRLIVADEAVSALDVSVQQQVLALLRDVRARLGLSMLFITHDLRVASQICDRIAVMHKGRIVETGTVEAVARAPKHPYTRSLFDAMPGQAWERRAQAQAAEPLRA